MSLLESMGEVLRLFFFFALPWFMLGVWIVGSIFAMLDIHTNGPRALGRNLPHFLLIVFCSPIIFILQGVIVILEQTQKHNDWTE